MFEDIVVISLLCWGIHVLTREGQILGMWQLFAYDKEKELRSTFFEPLSECVTCMASFWTCIYLCVIGETHVLGLSLFLIIFFTILFVDWATSKESSGIGKFLYLISVVGLISIIDSLIPCLIVMIGASALNYIICCLVYRVSPSDRE